MARVIDLALEAAAVLDSFSTVHAQVLGTPVRRWASTVGLREPIDYAGLEQQLVDLESKLTDIRAEVACLPVEERAKRARDDLPKALDMYARSLGDAMAKLRVICRRMGKAETSGVDRTAYDIEQLNADKVAYDLAVQESKRQGIRLGRLMSTF